MSKYWQGPPISVFGVNASSEHYYLYKPLMGIIEESVNEADAVILVTPIALPARIQIPENCERYECTLTQSSYDGLWAFLKTCFHKKVVVLTQGAPLFYNIGSILRKYLPREELVFYDAISKSQDAFNKIGQPFDHSEVIDLSRYPIELLRSRVKKNGWFAILTSKENTPQLIAKELVLCGLQSSEIWVFEHSGYNDEQIMFDYADALAKMESKFVEPTFVIVHVKGEGRILTEFTQVYDEFVQRKAKDSLYFNWQARMNVLFLLKLNPDEVGWVVGAGYGELALEWASMCKHSKIHAIEYVKSKAEFIYQNQKRMGLFENLHIHVAAAPPVLDDLEAPDTVFVNIDAQDTRFELILDICWEHLRLGGRLVVAARSEMTKASLFLYAKKMEKISEMKATSVIADELIKVKGKYIMQTQANLFIASWEKRFY